MKLIKAAALGGIALLALLATSDLRGENIIRQTMLDSGLQYQLITSQDQGSDTAFLPMNAGGSSFELYAYGSAWDTNLYFLDRKVVGHYLPTATIDIQTQDWYHDWFDASQPPRTRADKPYTLAISVSGLTADPTAPRAAQEVLYTHLGQNYEEDYVPGDNVEYILASYYMGNQSPNFTPVYTLLTPMAPTKAMGIETFTISSLTDETVTESSILANEMLVVWPVSEASIAGIEEGETIRDSLPNIVARYVDLYPLSWTYMQIYPGEEALGTVGEVFGGSIRWHNTIVPQNEVVGIENWEDMIPNDGTYTVEVLTLTPFDNWAPERLAHLTFSVNRKVTVNGQVITSEK